ncbi:MAG: hypothetical protein A2070_06120 [Bdellovibrionales bacterium GWC1_52_8]|nr:MAG: hypothetical protein A2Z97_14295 [Bdellovibrionales bacterium GWB1_52_6]OFZ04477.1 MAG: hypothetical protein A2X97_07310 [Bdellovibrionales bacterium GWA1_52_35]OFZ40562.1 MAG: hypothetical protein A2070_06120 [Bdellovibrionales bacterium GWC1_52_8]
MLKTELAKLALGPFDSALPGPLRLQMELDGEVIVSAKVETGFIHRGLEKAFERQRWIASISYADRLDPDGPIFGELALCLAVEEIAQLTVPPRAEQVRVLLSELGRISCHMEYLVRVARAVGSDTMIHYVLRDREKILDLFELTTGARYSINFLRFGGIQADITEGFIERILELSELFRIRVKEYNDLFTYNHAFIQRTQGVGTLSSKRVRELGVTGPNARAAGFSADIRKIHPYSGYDKIDFEVPVADLRGLRSGDANDRFLLRLREIAVSTEILRQVAENISDGAFCSRKQGQEIKVPAGEAYVRVESARGLLGCHVAADGGPMPARIQFRTPSHAHLAAIPELLSGTRLEDLPVVLSSLGLGVAEADR